MGKVTIQDIAVILSERHGLAKKEASGFVSALFDVVREALERDRIVKIKGLGTFKIIDVDARESVNVNTGERVLIEGHNKITFTPDALMKELVNKPFSQFETVVLNEGVDFEDTLKTVESVSDEIASEDLSSEEVASEEVASEEIASEEIPSEEVPAEEISSEEVPAEEIPYEEVPAEEIPSEAYQQVVAPSEDVIPTAEPVSEASDDPAAMPLVDFTSDTEETTEEAPMNEILDEDIPEWVIEPYVPEQKAPEQEPAAEEPVVEEPVTEEPVTEEPVVEEPVTEEPIVEETVLEEPEAVEELVIEGEPEEELVINGEPEEEPVINNEPAEESVAEEPVVEEPIAEEPVAEEPVAEPEVVEQETPQPQPSAIISETVEAAPVEEPQEDDENDLPEEESETSDILAAYEAESAYRRKKWLIGILAGLLGLVGGYLLGSFLPLPNVLPEYRLVVERVNTEKQAADVQATEPVAEPSAKQAEPVTAMEALEDVSDTKAEPSAEETKPEAAKASVKAEPSATKSEAPAAEKKPVAAAPQSVAPKAPEKKAETPAAKTTPDKYDAMDARVRLGAYRIVGTDHVEKVKEGDNLPKIARRTLGPDMECYIEVYNGLNASSQLKAGQSIKIPKLEWKKKKKAQTVN